MARCYYIEKPHSKPYYIRMSKSETWQQAIDLQQKSIESRTRPRQVAHKHEIQSRLGALASWAGAAGIIGYEQSVGTVAAATAATGAGLLLWKLGGEHRQHAEHCAKQQVEESDFLERLQGSSVSEDAAPEIE